MRLRNLSQAALSLVLVLAVAEAAYLLRELEGLWVPVLVLAAAAAGMLVAQAVPPRGLPFLAVLALGAPWLLLFGSFLAIVAADDSPLEPLANGLWHVALASPAAVAALAGVGLLGQSARAGALAAFGAAAASLVAGGLAGDWFRGHQPPPARYAEIAEERGAYGPVEIGASRAELLSTLGRISRAGLNESLTPTGAEDYEGPTGVPMSSRELYRYPDVVVWLDGEGRVDGFGLTSPGARTSRGVQVGSSLDDVRAAYPELGCGEAPQGDFFEYPYCAGRLGERRWIWFGGEPVTTITVAQVPLS